MSLRTRAFGAPWESFRAGRRARRPAQPSRRRLLRVEGLEQRLAPAIAGDLFVVGTTLVYNGNFADNNITVDGSDTAFQLLDSAGTINSTVPGMSPSELLNGSAVVPSYIQTIAINGQNGTDVLNLGPLTTTRNLIVAATTINVANTVTAANFTETSPLCTLANDISTNAGPIGGSVTFNGPVNVAGSGVEIDTYSTIDGNVTFNGPVVGSADLAVYADNGAGPASASQGNITAAGPINLGGDAGLTLEGNNVSLHQVIDSGGVAIVAQGAVTLNGSMITSGLVNILANQAGTGVAGFTQISGDIITSYNFVYLAVNTSSGGSGSATIGGITTGAGGSVVLETNGGGGIFDGNGPGVLNVNIPGPGFLEVDGGPLGINLDTSVSSIEFTQPATLPEQDVDIRNTGQALTVADGLTGGNVNITNDADLTIESLNSSGGNVTLTTTNGDIDNEGAIEADGPANTVNINSAGGITSAGIVITPNVVLNAATGIGGPFYLYSSNPVVTLSANTAAGGIDVTYGADTLQVNQATAGSGDVSIVPDGGNNLTINGNVSTQDGGNITLDANQALVFQGGTVVTDTGTITLAAGAQITLPANETVATGGAVVIGYDSVNSIQLGTGVEDLAGTVAAGGDITIVGGTDSTLLGVSGTISAGDALTIDTTDSVASSTLLLGGTLASGSGGTTIMTGGTTTITTTGLLSSGGTSTIGTAGLEASLVMDLAGGIQSDGLVTINGASGGFATVLDMSGTTTGDGVTIVSNGTTSGDTFLLTTTGTISGGATGVEIEGSTGDSNTFDIGGRVSGATIDVTAAGDAAISTFDITGVLSASGGATFESGSTGDAFVVAPSPATPFTFTFSGTASTLQIVTALANIQQVTATAVVFVPSLGYGNWTLSGTVTVAPTVP